MANGCRVLSSRIGGNDIKKGCIESSQIFFMVGLHPPLPFVFVDSWYFVVRNAGIVFMHFMFSETKLVVHFSTIYTVGESTIKLNLES